jgi:hypothetical protein
MTTVDQLLEILPLLLPLILVDLGFKIYAIFDIYNPNRVVRGNKIMWVLISILVSPFGWVFYFLFGRDE